MLLLKLSIKASESRVPKCILKDGDKAISSLRNVLTFLPIAEAGFVQHKYFFNLGLSAAEVCITIRVLVC